MEIKKYTQFIKENASNESDKSISDILSLIANVPTKDILAFKEELKKVANLNENLNENLISDAISSIKSRFRTWFTDKLFNYLINRKKEFYGKLINKLSIFDLTNIDDVYESFPTFKLTSMYLAGGMDAAKHGGKVGWRNDVEYGFEKHGGSKKLAPEIEIYLGPDGEDIKKIKPSYVVDGPMLDLFISKPQECKKFYNYPMLLNPVRKEVDRNKVDFDRFISGLKSTNQDKQLVDDAIIFFRKTFNDHIIPDDEKLIMRVDAIFLGLNKVAGAGTYGELQLLSFIEKPLFTCLVEGYENIVGNFKLWNFPQLCKLARNEEEMNILIETLYKSVNK